MNDLIKDFLENHTSCLFYKVRNIKVWGGNEVERKVEFTHFYDGKDVKLERMVNLWEVLAFVNSKIKS